MTAMPLCSWCLALAVLAAAWNPASIAEQSTLEFLTVAPDEGEHWSTVWFVVIDGNVYLRLGPRAAKRIEKNTTAPRFKIRIGGEVYPMRYQKVPEMADRIAAAMADKYWTDVFGAPFRRLGLTTAPVMLRVTPES